MQQPVSVVTKDMKPLQAEKEIESYTIGEIPMDPDRLEFMARVFEVAGKQDVMALRAAIASGDDQACGDALVEGLNEFLFGAVVPEEAPAPAARPMPVRMRPNDLDRAAARKSAAPPTWDAEKKMFVKLLKGAVKPKVAAKAGDEGYNRAAAQLLTTRPSKPGLF